MAAKPYEQDKKRSNLQSEIDRLQEKTDRKKSEGRTGSEYKQQLRRLNKLKETLAGKEAKWDYDAPQRAPRDVSPEIENLAGEFAAYRQQAQEQMERMQNLQAPQLDPAQEEARQQQMALAESLRARAEGRAGPSVAELQLQRGLQQQNALAMGQARSAYGANPALAMRAAMNAQAQGGQAMNAQAAQLRAQEQQQAEQALANVLSGARGQDIGAGQANLGAELQTQNLAEGGAQGYFGAGMQGLSQQMGGNISAEQLRQEALNSYLSNVNQRRSTSESPTQKFKSIWGSLI